MAIPDVRLGFFATITEGVGVAFTALGANKVRTGLTVLGVTIGVLVVMVMAAVITGVNQSFSEVISGRGTTTFYITHGLLMGMNTGLEEEEPEFFSNDPVNPSWARTLGRLPGIHSASAIADLSQSGYRAKYGSTEVLVSLAATGADFMEIDNGDIVDGRFFTRAEDERRTPVAVIDSATSVDLFGSLDPLGRTIRIGCVPGSFPPCLMAGSSSGQMFRIIGIYRAPANLFAGLGSHYVFVPFWSADKYLAPWDRLVSLVVRPEAELELDAALDLVYARMRQLRSLRAGEEDDFELITQDQIVELWNTLTSVLFTVMVALSSVGLLVGGVGVIGIMMISVTERTREIGLRKSIGARRRDILWQFLVEAATLTLFGGACGMAVGGAIVFALNTWTPIPAAVPMWSIIAALAASALTGVGFGLYPASRAAKLDPVVALHYE